MVRVFYSCYVLILNKKGIFLTSESEVDNGLKFKWVKCKVLNHG